MRRSLRAATLLIADRAPIVDRQAIAQRRATRLAGLEARDGKSIRATAIAGTRGPGIAIRASLPATWRRSSEASAEIRDANPPPETTAVSTVTASIATGEGPAIGGRKDGPDRQEGILRRAGG